MVFQIWAWMLLLLVLSLWCLLGRGLNDLVWWIPKCTHSDWTAATSPEITRCRQLLLFCEVENNCANIRFVINLLLLIVLLSLLITPMTSVWYVPCCLGYCRLVCSLGDRRSAPKQFPVSSFPSGGSSPLPIIFPFRHRFWLVSTNVFLTRHFSWHFWQSFFAMRGHLSA